MPRPLPSDHSAFGPCLTVRRRGLGDWGLMLILFALLGVFGVFLLFAGVAEVRRGDYFGLFLIAISLVFFSLIIPCVLYLLTRFEFYSGGAVIRKPTKSREFSYSNATFLEYSLTRQFVNGVYAGTAQRLVYKTADGRKFRFGGTHKERPKTFTFFKREFKGEDELDAIRFIISAEVAKGYFEAIHAGQPVDWCKQVQLTAAGVVPLRGKRKGQLVPWSDIAGISADKGAYHIFANGDKRSFAGFAMNAPNFYPGLDVFSALFAPYLPEESATDDPESASIPG